MMNQAAMLIAGLVCSALAWASWHFYSESVSMALMVIVLVGYGIDNFQLRRQVRRLIADRDRHEQSEKRQRRNMYQRLIAILLTERDKRR